MSMQDLIEQGIECGADANEISNVLFSNGFGKTETLQQKINELQLSLDLQWEAGQRAIKMWQAETGKELVWPDKADLCVWLMQKNQQLQTINQQLLESLIDAEEKLSILGFEELEIRQTISKAKQQESGNVTHSK